MHIAAESNSNPAVITALLDAGADPKALNKAGKTPWDYAKDNEALKGEAKRVSPIIHDNWWIQWEGQSKRRQVLTLDKFG